MLWQSLRRTPEYKLIIRSAVTLLMGTLKQMSVISENLGNWVVTASQSQIREFCESRDGHDDPTYYPCN